MILMEKEWISYLSVWMAQIGFLFERRKKEKKATDPLRKRKRVCVDEMYGCMCVLNDNTVHR